MSIFNSVASLKAGMELINKFEEAMNKHKFNYEDFKTLQDNYEKLIWDLCQQAFVKGTENISDELFLEWLKEQSCYREEGK